MAWASRSRRGRARGPARAARILLAACALGGSLAVGVAPARAKVYLSRSEALAWAFPDADRVDERTFVLTDAQANAVERLARAPVETRIVKLYTALEDGAATGYAFIDIHTVRTLPEAFLVVLTPGGAVRSLRVLAFYEPPEYLPPENWLEQFEQGTLGSRLEPGAAIHGIAGSTLSAQAVSAGVRRSLALWEVLVGRAAPPATPRDAAPTAAAPGDGDAGGEE